MKKNTKENGFAACLMRNGKSIQDMIQCRLQMDETAELIYEIYSAGFNDGYKRSNEEPCQRPHL